ncbi:MAG TPA: arylesterase [Gammaproteobacteria bacterium]
MLKKIILVCLYLFCLPALAGNKTLLILGDSLSAGYGISLRQGWVSLLEDRLEKTGHSYQVVNKSISGETTQGVKVRLDNILSQLTPDVTVVELGGNDGLRGFSPEEIRTNLSNILDRLLESGSRVLLIPMKLPPNYGEAYNQKFSLIYSDLAEEKDIKEGKFILEGIAGDHLLMQADGIHPEAHAQEQMLDNVWHGLEPLL